MYKTEADFSKYITARLQREHIMVTRIESHGTGNGIPDMFVCGRGLDTWLELKNSPKLSIKDKKIKVAWRPGQVAWMFTYHTKHTIKNCLTLVAVSDGVFIIPMTCTFQDHFVYNPQGITYEDLGKIKLFQVLDAMSTYWLHQKKSDEDDTTYLDYINSFVDYFYPGIDYDPECLWNPDLLDYPADIKVFNNQKLDIIMTMEHTAMNNKEVR